MDPTLRSFLCGVFGSVAVELALFVKVARSGRGYPAYYGHYGFWIARVLMALCGGGLAAAYHIESPILAIQIGASTPALLDQLAKAPSQPRA